MVPLVLLGVALLAVAGLVLAQLGGRAYRMTRAQTAADAAALAGAASGEAAARHVAEANDGVLTGFEQGAGGAVRADVTFSGGPAAAAAIAPRAGAPALAAALDRVADVLGPDAVGALTPLPPPAVGVVATRSVAGHLAVAEDRTGLCRAPDGRPLVFVLCPAPLPP